MEILSEPINDGRIEAYNVMTQMTLKEYFDLVKDSMDKNDLQRAKVPSSKNIYSLLKEDLVMGCVIPPIVLSIFSAFDADMSDKKQVEKYIYENKHKLIILDGLQRTFTIQDIYNTYINNADSKVLENRIRVEVYLGLNREGVLYRMLTLNTGQTRMSLRHQIEMIYQDLLNSKDEDDLRFIKDTEKDNKKKFDVFYFSEAVDAFTSYLNNDYLQLTREKILVSIETFSDLTKLKNNRDAFIDLMSIYSQFIAMAEQCLENKEEDLKQWAEEAGINPVFGTNAINIFNKSQSMTGFGAAVAKLLEFDTFAEITEISEAFDEIDKEDFYEGTTNILSFLDWIRNHSSKIGNSQRCYFYYFFRKFLDRDNKETYKKASAAALEAKKSYERDF